MTKKQSKRNRGGFVLLFVVLTVMLLFIIGLGLTKLGSGARMQAARTTAGISARSAADAGFTQAMRLMDEKLKNTKLAGETWDNSWIPYQSPVMDLPNSYASFSFEITGAPGSGWQIASTGKSGVAEKTVHSTLKVQSLWFGIGVQQNITAKAKAAFGTVPPNSDFMLRTDSIEAGAIVLNNDVVVPGDVVVGPGGDPESVIILKEGAVIQGQTYAATDEIYYPSIRLPELTDWEHTGQWHMHAKGITKTVGPAGSGDTYDFQSGRHHCIKLTLSTADPNKTGRLKIYGDVVLHITSYIEIAQGCELIVTEDASLTLYLDGDLLAKQGSGIINENVKAGSTDEEIALAAGSLKIYGTDGCTSIDLMTKSDFYGAIYAQNAELLLRNDGDLYGAFVGKSVDMNNSSGLFYYTAALAIISVDDETASGFGTERWWE